MFSVFDRGSLKRSKSWSRSWLGYVRCSGWTQVTVVMIFLDKRFVQKIKAFFPMLCCYFFCSIENGERIRFLRFHTYKNIFSPSQWHIFIDASCLELSRYRLVSDWMMDRNNPIRRKDTESSNRFSDICVRFLYMQEPNEQTKMSMVGNCRAIFRSWGKYAVKDIYTLAIIRGRNSFLFNDYSPQGKRILPTCYLFSLSFCLRDFKHRVVAIFMSPCAGQ